MLQNSRPNTRALFTAVAALILLFGAATPLRAQSGEASHPTPVFAGEVNGRIAPRDLGDPRRTRHFYTFRGTEGDLVVTLETAQLIGDVDVFTATTFRPLLKFTLFGDAARLSKSFYLRKEESLVLRVEARAVGDAEGTYTIRFGGSFLPAPAELANVPEPSAPTLPPSASRGNTRRVTSTGARIEEPKAEPTPREEAAEARPTPTPTPERAAERKPPPAPRRGRATRNAPSRTRAGADSARPEAARPRSAETRAPGESSNTTGSTEGTTAGSAPLPAEAPRRRGTRAAGRGSARAGATTTRRGEPASRPPAEGRAEPAAAEPAAPTQRLIIVTKDGETLERDMSGVRRVTVENNQVVIVTKDGKVTRRPLASVLRMSIEP